LAREKRAERALDEKNDVYAFSFFSPLSLSSRAPANPSLVFSRQK